jgi:heme/copper-type cytochrome/quinol oxidase subunit 4
MADLTIWAARGTLVLMRLILFGLSLGLTVISFQAYQKQKSERLQYAFVGFAFISMGVAVSSVITQLSAGQASALARVFFQMAETIPFIIGFAMLYVSLYR